MNVSRETFLYAKKSTRQAPGAFPFIQNEIHASLQIPSMHLLKIGQTCPQ